MSYIKKESFEPNLKNREGVSLPNQTSLFNRRGPRELTALLLRWKQVEDKNI